MNEPHFIPDEAEIHAYVDGRLDAAGCARLEAWMARHPDRAGEIRAWRRDAQQLRAALGALPSSADNATLDPAHIRARRRYRTRRRITLAAMLILALGVGFMGGWQLHRLSAPQTAPMADALQAYRMFALKRPVKFDVRQSHPGELQAWLAAHFPHAAPLPRLTGAGFHPVGGRLLITASGPAAMVLYEDARGNAISFYIRPPSPRNGLLAPGRRRAGHLVTAYWSGNGYNYALVARAVTPELQVINQAPLAPGVRG